MTKSIFIWRTLLTVETWQQTEKKQFYHGRRFVFSQVIQPVFPWQDTHDVIQNIRLSEGVAPVAHTLQL
jgi:hypothetical protein